MTDCPMNEKVDLAIERLKMIKEKENILVVG